MGIEFVSCSASGDGTPETVDIRQMYVKKNQIRGMLGGQLQTFRAGPGFDDFEVREPQNSRNGVTSGFIVVDVEDQLLAKG